MRPMSPLSSPSTLPDVLVRFLFVVLGMGTLFTYNALVSCTDYFNALQPLVPNISGQMVTFQLTFMFLMTLCLLPVSTVKQTRIIRQGDQHTHASATRKRCHAIACIFYYLKIDSPARRVLYGFVFTFVFLFVYILLPPSCITSSTLNVFAIFVGIADAMSQSGLYILAASYRDKPVYTAAATLGGALSGFIVSVLRLVTRSLFDSATLDGLRKGADLLMRIAFGFSAFLIVAICIILQDGVHAKRQRENQEQCHHVGEVSDARCKEEEEDGNGVVVQEESNMHREVLELTDTNETGDVRSYAQVLGQVYGNTLHLIWKPALSSFLNFFITLSLFPGVVVDIPSSSGRYSVGNWLPIVLITVFNLADCLGRYILAFESKLPFQLLMDREIVTIHSSVDTNTDTDADVDVDEDETRGMPLKQGHSMLKYYQHLVWWPTSARVIFFPLLAMCILPFQQPIIHSDILRGCIVFVFGLSNGFIQCANFTVAPTLVESEEMKNAVSLLLLLAIFSGLAFGALFGLLVEKVIRSFH